jgi:hypothetical protein
VERTLSQLLPGANKVENALHDAEFCIERKLLGFENCLPLEYANCSTCKLLYVKGVTRLFLLQYNCYLLTQYCIFYTIIELVFQRLGGGGGVDQ